MTKQLTRNILLVSISVLVLIPCASFSQEPAPPAKHQKNNVTKLHVAVTVGDESEPVSGADVFVKSEDEDTPFDRTVRTDRRGAVNFARVPRVRILIQVTADGYKTFGDHYDLTQESQTIAIKLEKNNDDGR
jgi:hypothetical protein